MNKNFKEYIDNIIAPNCNNNKEIIDAFIKYDRIKFVDEAFALKAYKDDALPIGFGQTISKPSTVAYMTYLLNVKPTDRILEIGTGSGFQAAILSYLCDTVYTVERIQKLYLRASDLLRKFFIHNVKFKLDNGILGWEERAPFDKIIVTAAADILPEMLLKQLKLGGKMIIPIDEKISLITKHDKGYSEEKLKNCNFVKFIM
jgi:protein-L-isoaspartate(D-aspartate) O-methyltransferase